MAHILKVKGSSKYVVRYTDHTGKARQKSTRTTDRRLAERFARDLQVKVDARKNGMIDDHASAFEQSIKKPLHEHIEEYLSSCVDSGQATRRLKGKTKHLYAVASFMHATRLSDLQPDAFRQWMRSLKDSGLSPNTVNEYRCTVVAFLNWCEQDGRIPSNTLKHVSKLTTVGVKFRNRRALSDDEVARLLATAFEQDQLNIDRDWSPRHPVYLVALFTGLRKNELKQICWSDVDLESASLHVRAEVSKVKRQDDIPLHSEVVKALADMKPEGVCGRVRVFANIPILRTFKLDCTRAGIPLKDSEGRTVDFHSLRTTFSTRMIRQGIQPAYVQRLMRHADIKTTNNHYTDLRLHDLDSAVNQLSLPVEQPVELRATGTDDPSQTITETVTKPCTNERNLGHFSANACEVHGRNMSDQTKHKPRSGARLCEPVRCTA